MSDRFNRLRMFSASSLLIEFRRILVPISNRVSEGISKKSRMLVISRQELAMYSLKRKMVVYLWGTEVHLGIFSTSELHEARPSSIFRALTKKVELYCVLPIPS